MPAQNAEREQNQDSVTRTTAQMEETMAGAQTQLTRMMTGNAELARVWMDGWSRMMTELMDFSGRRLRDNVEALERTARCQDPAEALRMQMSGLENTVRVYADEAGRIYNLCSQTGEECLKALDSDNERHRSSSRGGRRESSERRQAAE
jgi:hypothetical protein